MRTLIKNALVLQGNEFKYLNVVLNDDIIEEIIPQKEGETLETIDQVVDLAGKYLTPGFIDIHTHGAVNEDVNNTSPAGLAKISKFFASQGTTSWLMSVLTDERASVKQAITHFNDYQAQIEKVNNLLGIHLEGPFLSEDYRGSMPLHLLQAYDPTFVPEMQALANGCVRYMTLAPEVTGVAEGIPEIQQQGVVVSMGHSGATYEVAKQAITDGVASCTHTFNAMGLFHQHHPGVMGAVLESDTIYCEAICDGRHLHPGTIRMLIKTMGLDKVVMITDSIMAAGLADGEYRLGVNHIVVKDGDARLRDQDVRAGSTLTMQQALLNMLQFTDLSIGQILQMMTSNPARLLGIFDEYGSITVGKKANLLQLDLDGSLLKTWVDGQIVYQK